MGTNWTASVDRETCVGSGLCVASMPELFEFDEHGRSHPRNEGAVRERLADLAQAAADLCPVEAISLRLAGK